MIEVPSEGKEAIAEARARIRKAAELAGIRVQTVYSRSHQAVLGLIEHPPEVEQAQEEEAMAKRRHAVRRHTLHAVDDGGDET